MKIEKTYAKFFRHLELGQKVVITLLALFLAVMTQIGEIRSVWYNVPEGIKAESITQRSSVNLSSLVWFQFRLPFTA